MTTTIPIQFRVDHKKKSLVMRVKDDADHEIVANVDLQGISELMAILSHCEYAIVNSMAGNEISPPLDPRIAFQPVAGAHGVGAYDGLGHVAVGIDEAAGLVALTMLGASRRLSGFRMSPDKARNLGQSLIGAADSTPAPPKSQ